MTDMQASIFALIVCALVAAGIAFGPPRDKPTCVCIGDDCEPDPCKLYGWDAETGRLTKGPFANPD
jgi:hypothetical protein